MGRHHLNTANKHLIKNNFNFHGYQDTPKNTPTLQ